MGLEMGEGLVRSFMEGEEVTWDGEHPDKTELRMMMSFYGQGPFTVTRTEDVPREDWTSAGAHQFLYLKDREGIVTNSRGRENMISAYWFILLRQSPFSTMRR